MLPGYGMDGNSKITIQTRHKVGSELRGLHRRILQACIEQVALLDPVTSMLDFALEGAHAISCKLQDDFEMALSFMQLLPPDPRLFNTLLKLCIDRNGDERMLKAALQVC